MEIYFQLQFDHLLWRILPSQSETSNEWVIETRNPTDKSVQHTLIDLNIPAVIWQQTLIPIDWSTQLAGFSGDLLYFHFYRQADLPQPTDLLAINSKTKEIVWTLPNYTLLRIENETTILTLQKQGEGLREQWFDLSSGTPLALQALATDQAPVSYQTPTRYLPENIYFSTINSFLKDLLATPDAAVIDYLEATNFLILSYYLYQENKYHQSLLILDKEGTILFHTTTGNQLTGIGLETVLLKNENLVFLTNNNEFTSLNLQSLQ